MNIIDVYEFLLDRNASNFTLEVIPLNMYVGPILYLNTQKESRWNVFLLFGDQSNLKLNSNKCTMLRYC